MRYWKKLNRVQIESVIFEANKRNVDYNYHRVLGIPASHLDTRVFYSDNSLLKDAPYLSTLVQNPNHIGCHTLGESTSFFKGTQDVEKELIYLCAEDILHGEKDDHDGYVASGGTEANIEAIWVYRNYFMQFHGAKIEDICILCSEDTHYSVFKAANLAHLDLYSVDVNKSNRKLDKDSLLVQLQIAKTKGKNYVIVIANMMTTMFGSVDDIDLYIESLESEKLEFKIHVDGAFGGFVYPFSNKNNRLDFSNPHVTSVTLDAHKMVEAPYGTGLFLIRKGYIKYVHTPEANYVQGPEVTLSGSRSGANAISVWMILMTYGPNGWHEKIHILNHRTTWFCQQLDDLNIGYFRHPGSNIVAIRSKGILKKTAEKFGLIPDTHTIAPSWYKVVIMSHVTVDELNELITEMRCSENHSIHIAQDLTV